MGVVPRSVVRALRWVPKSRVSFKTWMHLPMGVQVRDRRVVRELASEEKVRDLVGEILAPKSEKKIRVCWKPSTNKVQWCKWGRAFGRGPRGGAGKVSKVSNERVSFGHGPGGGPGGGHLDVGLGVAQGK